MERCNRTLCIIPMIIGSYAYSCLLNRVWTCQLCSFPSDCYMLERGYAHLNSELIGTSVRTTGTSLHTPWVLEAASLVLFGRSLIDARNFRGAFSRVYLHRDAFRLVDDNSSGDADIRVNGMLNFIATPNVTCFR
jgi:hypothetical protein